MRKPALLAVNALLTLSLCACSGGSKGMGGVGGGTQSYKHLYCDDTGHMYAVFDRAYQATYKTTGGFAYDTEKIFRDGAGHVRSETSGLEPTAIQVLDLNKNQFTIWSPVGKQVYIQRKAMPMDPLVMRINMENLPRDQGAIGEQVIDGHKCHGYEKDGTEIWYDDDFNCPVKMTNGTAELKLVEFTDKAPDPSLFEPPPGYTRTKQSSNFFN